jgi:hypothetical protein
MPKLVKKISSNEQLGIRVYTKLLILMDQGSKLCHIQKYNCQEYNAPTSQQT